MSGNRAPLWITIRGASRWVIAGWAGWVVAVAVLGPRLSAEVGGGGVVVSVLTVGWFLARRCPAPGAALRRYHVDDREITVMGPGRRVRRVAWDECRSYAATGAGLRLQAPGCALMLPVPPGGAEALWHAVLASMVPERAESIWRSHEHGAVRLVPVLQPPALGLAVWAWLPAALTVVLTPSASTAALALGLAAAQCLVARARSVWRSVVLQPSGVVAPGEGRRSFVAWDEIQTSLGPAGLELHGPRGSGVVSADVPDFMAVVAVIRLHADLGFAAASHVTFRLAWDHDGLAVVGEVEG